MATKAAVLGRRNEDFIGGEFWVPADSGGETGEDENKLEGGGLRIEDGGAQSRFYIPLSCTFDLHLFSSTTATARRRIEQ